VYERPVPIDFFRSVFDHVQIGCSDFPESLRFYRTVLDPLGIPVVSETEQWVMFMHYAIRPDRPPTTNLHVAFLASSREAVDAFHTAGVDAGFRDNGAPGLRYEDFSPGIYAAYLLDPDGNNVEAVHRMGLSYPAGGDES
jgi:catechol 2,3-dioxygenase-like lactoylglutathione lyase family enzyme